MEEIQTSDDRPRADLHLPFLRDEVEVRHRKRYGSVQSQETSWEVLALCGRAFGSDLGVHVQSAAMIGVNVLSSMVEIKILPLAKP